MKENWPALHTPCAIGLSLAQGSLLSPPASPPGTVRWLHSSGGGEKLLEESGWGGAQSAPGKDWPGQRRKSREWPEGGKGLGSGFRVVLSLSQWLEQVASARI